MPAGPSYWKLKFSALRTRDPVHGFSAVTTTPTAIAILVKEWNSENFPMTSKGRLRKTANTGITGSASWAQEMMARMVLQDNPNLLPTAEACEQFMGIPIGWTELDAAETASYGLSRRSSGRSSRNPKGSGRERLPKGDSTLPQPKK